MAISRAPQAFPRSEYMRRITAVKAEMERWGVEALVISDANNITYLSGYTALSAYVPQALLVSIREQEPTFILRQCDAPAALHETFMERDRIISYPESLIGNPEKNGYDAVIDHIQEAGYAKQSIGVELDDLPSRAPDKFKSRLPASKIVDCSKLATWIRLVKSDLEIAVMRECAAISDAAVLRAAEVIRPGVREADVIAEIVGTLVRGANGKPGTRIPPVYLCASPRTGTCHIPWADDVFRQGSQINLELGGSRHGYYAGLMRTYSIGAPSERLRRIHEIQVEGLEAALEAIRPGATCSDVANAFCRTIGKQGLKKETRCGYAHGIGWLEPTASLKDGDTTILVPNMTFHLMLGNWIDEDFGYVISETFRVSQSGVEVLTAAPRKIFEL
ncbi:Xaa-Pro peptidase family protein [Mesorhizobium sp. M1163]|uniref:M24 family metallopeptidase n=1 Tax=Mesorhizobium sp. M1163 TaxID=2957065 RepID=UPI0033371A1A